MKQEDKDLLLKYLCMVLPYGVILSVGVFDNGTMKYHNEKLDYHSKLLSLIELDGAYSLNGLIYKYYQFTAKPYLRSMSSMTLDESIELFNIINEWWYEEFFTLIDEKIIERALSRLNYSINPMLFNWLLENHFDFMGLIPKDLAIEVDENNNPYNND